MVLASALRQAGYAVAVCPGPAETERCPLSGPEGCSVAHGADVIVSSLGFDRVESRDVLQSLRTRLPDARLVVEVNAGRQNEWTDILQGCELVHAPATPDEVLSAVERALSRTA
jgi:DNA-binding NarL/FixJ family response regulator